MSQIDRLIYLNWAATSFAKPPEVEEAVCRVLRELPCTAGRGHDPWTQEAQAVIDNTRACIANLFGVPSSNQVIFTKNGTEPINLVLRGLLQPGDHVIATSMEHNAVSRPLRRLEGEGVKLTVVPGDVTGRVDPRALAEAVRPETRLACVVHVSNVTGTLQPIRAIAALLHERGVPLLVDAAQSAGVIPIHIDEDRIDWLACPGHKGLLGPQGTGFLCARKLVDLRPLIDGGTGSFSEEDVQPEAWPDRFESGSLNIPAIAGLGAALEWLHDRGVESVWDHEQRLVSLLVDGLSQVEGVRIYGPRRTTARVGVTLFTIGGWDPVELTQRLAEEYQILTRAGLHCAPWAHQTIGTYPAGGVRMSVGVFTQEWEIQQAIEAVERLVRLGPVSVDSRHSCC